MSEISSAQLMAKIFSTSRLMREEVLEAVAEDGQAPRLSFPQLVTLKFVKDVGRPTMNDLAVFLRVTPPSVTSITSGLVRAGLMRRESNKADRRSVRLGLTPRGSKLLARRMRVVVAHLRTALSVLTAAERRQFFIIMDKMAQGRAAKKTGA